MKFDDVERVYSLEGAQTADTIAELVRAILSQKYVVVRELHLLSDPGRVVAQLSIPRSGPPDGVIPETDPESVWELLTQVDIVEYESANVKLNPAAVSSLTHIMLEAGHRRLAGVAWATGSIQNLMKWVGVHPREGVPATFWNMPLIQTQLIPEDCVVMLCAKSVRQRVLKAELGIMAQFEEVDDVGQSE